MLNASRGLKRVLNTAVRDSELAWRSGCALLTQCYNLLRPFFLKSWSRPSIEWESISTKVGRVYASRTVKATRA